MKKYQRTDTMGNVDTLIVRDDNAVRMHNQHRIPECLSNVAFNIPNVNGYVAQANAVRDAARLGLAELRRVTKLDWIELEVPVELKTTIFEPIWSMYKLREYYRTFDAKVDWLVTVVEGTLRKGGRRYTGTLLQVLTQMEVDYEVGLLSDLEGHEEAPDRMNTLIESNGTVQQFIIFDLKNNRQIM
ncbi:hypothetical protein D3C75_396270 [compost metagenome]